MILITHPESGVEFECTEREYRAELKRTAVWARALVNAIEVPDLEQVSVTGPGNSLALNADRPAGSTERCGASPSGSRKVGT